MMCAVCAGAVEKAVSSTPGVVEANVNFAASSVTIRWDETETDPDIIAGAVASAGYEMIILPDLSSAVEQHDKEDQKRFDTMKWKVILAWVLTIPLAFICMGNFHFPGAEWVMCVMALAVMVFCGARFYTTGIKSALKGYPTMDTLVAVSTLASFLISLFNSIWPDVWISRGLPADL